MRLLMSQKRSRYAVLIVAVCAVLCFSASLGWALPGDSGRAGEAYGRNHAQAVSRSVQEMLRAGEARGVDYQEVLEGAKSREALYREVLPEKVAWMKGVARGAGISYEDLLILNTAHRQMTGFVGECTTFIAQGSALEAGHGALIAKNRDLGAHTISEVALEEAREYEDTALYRGAYIDIPQAAKTYRFVGSRSAGRWGYGMGINEKQVAVSDNDAPTRDALSFTEGLHDNDYVRLVLERAGTAREGVEILTKLTEKYGQAWNSIMFEIADPQELWVVEIAGYRWVAKKYENTVTARSNQFQITDDYDFAAEDLISFAVSKGWIPAGTKRINFRAVYGGTSLYPEDNENLENRPATEILYNTEVRYQRAMELLKGIEGAVSPKAVLPLVRDHYDVYTLPSGEVLELEQVPFYSSKCADMQEWIIQFPEKDTVEKSIFPRPICHHGLGGITASSAILVTRPDLPNELGAMLHCIMQPCNSLFVPFYVGASSVDPRFTSPEAGSLFMTISKVAFGAYRMYHEVIRSVFDPYEEALFGDMASLEKDYAGLVAEKKMEEAQKLLDAFGAEKTEQAYMLAKKAITAMFKTAAESSAWSRD
ncbi:MAG TPA: C69 family dipeptidase [Synergistaceae bacterium]|nr:C69 family dipeptidase [Synergistaceae bacterium]